MCNEPSDHVYVRTKANPHYYGAGFEICCNCGHVRWLEVKNESNRINI